MDPRSIHPPSPHVLAPSLILSGNRRPAFPVGVDIRLGMAHTARQMLPDMVKFKWWHGPFW